MSIPQSIQKMTAAMVACIGAHETNGDNVNFITQWFGENGGAWCDMTITYAAYHSGNQGPVCFNAYHDNTVEHANSFWDRGQWHTDVAGIQTGDIVFFDWAGSNDINAIDHVGYVESVGLVDNTPAVYTIEGNIDNVCKRMVRHSDFIVGYGRPRYALDPVTPPPPPGPTPNPTPPPPVVLPTVSLAHIVAATAGSTGFTTEVGRVQNALAKLGFIHFTDRGVFGPLTRAGYSAYQKSLYYSGADADGIPGADSLTKLGTKTGLFKEVA